MKEEDKVKLYGILSCRKTQSFIKFLTSKDVSFSFFDISDNQLREQELKILSSSDKVATPTVVIGHKVICQPSFKKLQKWLKKADAANYKDTTRPKHDTREFRFTCGISKAKGDISDSIGY